jgi:ribosomal protein L21E
MRRIATVGLILIGFYGVWGQTTTTSGNWSDGTIWSGGTAPTATSGTCTGGSASLGTCTTPVSVGNVVTIDQNVSISTGVVYMGYNGTTTTSTNATDQAGGSAYTIALSRGGGYSATEGILDIKSGITTFEGAMTIFT